MTPRGLVTMAAMLAIGLAAVPAWAGATEAHGALKLSCENGALNLNARDALAPEVFRALENKCGLLLVGSENIPLAQTYEERKRSLEAMMRLDAEEARDLDNLNGDALEFERRDVRLEDARRRFLVAQSEEEKQKALEDAKKIYPDAADELGDLDNEERKEAALDDLLMQYYLSRTDEDRKRAYEAVKKLDPEEAKHLLLED
ncbi:MAG: hypothetical protein IH975_10705 [Nitrospinae bacterium]|nr:hypothetical protein [Nitrospinota bacterium]